MGWGRPLEIHQWVVLVQLLSAKGMSLELCGFHGAFPAPGAEGICRDQIQLLPCPGHPNNPTKAPGAVPIPREPGQSRTMPSLVPNVPPGSRALLTQLQFAITQDPQVPSQPVLDALC